MTPLTTIEQKAIKNHFEKSVDKSSRKSMINFLKSHHRYYTMNSWNASTSYSHCIKLTHLPLPNDINDISWKMLDCEEWLCHMKNLMLDFDEFYHFSWQVGINGMSGGYMVLRRGGLEKDGRIFVHPGKSIDQNEDFGDWDIDSLRDRVTVVKEFDILVSNIVIDFGAFCRTYNIIDKEILIPKIIKVLQKK